MYLRVSMTALILYVIFFSGYSPALSAPSKEQNFKEISADLVKQAEEQAKLSDFPAAQISYERALVANPANIKAHIGVGRMHDLQGRTGRSLKYYRQALELDPTNPEALRYQAYAFLNRNLIEYAARNADRLAQQCLENCDDVDALKAVIASKRKSEETPTSDSVKEPIADQGPN